MAVDTLRKTGEVTRNSSARIFSWQCSPCSMRWIHCTSSSTSQTMWYARCLFSLISLFQAQALKLAALTQSQSSMQTRLFKVQAGTRLQVLYALMYRCMSSTFVQVDELHSKLHLIPDAAAVTVFTWCSTLRFLTVTVMKPSDLLLTCSGKGEPSHGSGKRFGGNAE